MHYQRWKIRGSTDKPPRPKKPIPHGTMQGYNFHGCRCDECRDRYNEYQRQWHEENPTKRNGYARKHMLLSKYGMTLDDFESMLAAQGGGCAICGNGVSDARKKVLGVDHDHKTGKVRGILCGPCNAAVGLLSESTDRATKLIEYLRRAQSL